MTSEGKKTKAVPLLDLDKERVEKSEAQDEELLPGIPNEITLNQVLTKLPNWRDFYTLSSVNRSWLQAIRSHEVFQARVRSNSAETLAVLLRDSCEMMSCISLYSVRDERVCDVPSIPKFAGIPARSQCVSLDGKLYVLGGVKDANTELASDEVYVLDLAGQRGWRRCASMHQRRQQFGCGIMNGKIHVFGGLSLRRPTSGAEVYDPEGDVWSPLPAMLSLRFNHRVATSGDDLIVHGGNTFLPSWKDDLKVDRQGRVSDLAGMKRGYLPHYYVRDSTVMEVYSSNKENWQSLGPNFLKPTAMDFVMFAKEGIYSINWRNIHVQKGQNEWTHLHSVSSRSSIKPRYSDFVWPLVPVVADHELLAIVHWQKWEKSYPEKSCIVRSKGFCSEKKEIVWEDARCKKPKNCSRLLLECIICTVRL